MIVGKTGSLNAAIAEWNPMPRDNHEVDLDTDGMSQDAKLDLIIEGLIDLQDEFQVFREELLEKIANINLPGVDYELDSFDN